MVWPPAAPRDPKQPPSHLNPHPFCLVCSSYFFFSFCLFCPSLPCLSCFYLILTLLLFLRSQSFFLTTDRKDIDPDGKAGEEELGEEKA